VWSKGFACQLDEGKEREGKVRLYRPWITHITDEGICIMVVVQPSQTYFCESQKRVSCVDNGTTNVQVEDVLKRCKSGICNQKYGGFEFRAVSERAGISRGGATELPMETASMEVI
jgi:hypothetical protein